ncbi:MAG TPA: hypothetical protein PLC65_10250 [Bacteroidia bacterium]|nr:hypothetical protein [Bacteroidia bacterium]HRD39001.1 hypothetical protein [Bacteroidia bacterium]
MENKPESFEEKAKEYFDEKKYRTIIVGKDGYKSNEDLEDAITALVEDKISTEEKEEILKHLKASKAKQALFKAIQTSKSDAKKAKLIAACWEIDLDCTDDFLFFVDLTCNEDFNVSLEALTVIESIENAIPANQLEQAQKQVTAKIKEKPDNIDLLVDLLQIIKDRSEAV